MSQWVQWLPVLVVVVTAISGLATYGYQKSVDRRNTLVDLRRTFYAEFLSAWAASHLRKKEEAASLRYSDARLKMYAIGSDEVVRSVAKITRIFEERKRRQLDTQPMNEGEAKEVRAALAEAVVAMRRDCFQKTSLSAADISEILPIGGAPTSRSGGERESA